MAFILQTSSPDETILNWEDEEIFVRLRDVEAYITRNSRCYDELGEHKDGRGRRYSYTTWTLRSLRVIQVDCRFNSENRKRNIIKVS